MLRKIFPSWQTSGVEQRNSVEDFERDCEQVKVESPLEIEAATEAAQPPKPRKSKGTHSFKKNFQKFSHKHRNKNKDENKVKVGKFTFSLNYNLLRFVM